MNIPPGLSKRCLFVVGHARSGTTVLENCLNNSPDVLLMSEASWSLHLNRSDFVPHFNQMHKELNSPKLKDTWIPPSQDGKEHGVDTLVRLASHYRWIGEKVCFGPHGLFGTRTFQEVFFEFHTQFFYDSTYILIIRKPSEVFHSCLKMFSDRGPAEIIRTWLDTMLVQMDIFENFPNRRWCFLEDLDVALINNLASELNVSANVPARMVMSGRKASDLSDAEIPPGFEDWSEAVLLANQLYRTLKLEVNDPTDTYRTCTRFLRADVEALRAVFEGKTEFIMPIVKKYRIQNPVEAPSRLAAMTNS